MTVGLIIVAVLVVVGVLLLLWAVGAYNKLVKQRNQVDAAWAQIDVQLSRRHDLIPNLVETVRGYATHERETLDAVIQARNAAMANAGAEPASRSQSEGALGSVLGRLFALAEAYPNLRANENFAALQGELANTEDKIAYARQFYNAAVQTYNTSTETIPTNLRRRPRPVPTPRPVRGGRRRTRPGPGPLLDRRAGPGSSTRVARHRRRGRRPRLAHGASSPSTDWCCSRRDRPGRHRRPPRRTSAPTPSHPPSSTSS